MRSLLFAGHFEHVCAYMYTSCVVPCLLAAHTHCDQVRTGRLSAVHAFEFEIWPIERLHHRSNNVSDTSRTVKRPAKHGTVLTMLKSCAPNAYSRSRTGSRELEKHGRSVGLFQMNARLIYVCVCNVYHDCTPTYASRICMFEVTCKQLFAAFLQHQLTSSSSSSLFSFALLG